MTNEDKNKAIERSNAYREMLNSWAWKDFLNVLKEEKDVRIAKLMIGGTDNIEYVRGFTSAMNFIESEIGYILEGVQ